MKNLSLTKSSILGYLLMALLIIPTSEAFGQRNKDKKSSYSVQSNHSNGKSTIHVTNNGKDFKIEYEGEFELSNDDKDITSITSGGFIEITKSSFGNKRRIVIESDRSGDLIRRYYVGRSEKDYEPDGRAWLAEILPEVVRTTTIAAKSRVDRFYAKGGSSAVLNEIKQMDSDYIKSAYFKLLLENNLSNTELVSVIEQTGREINSDHYLSEILKSNQKAFLANDQTIDAYIKASKSINSDHYLTSVLKQVVNDSSISDSQMDSLLEISKSVNSDHYLTEILTEIMDSRNLNSQNVSKIISLSRDIQSDHYKTQVLKKVIREGNDMPSSAYTAFIATLNDIQSDHYVTEVIKQLMKSNLSGNDLDSLLNLVKSNVSSDHYATNIYKSIANQNLSEDQLITVLNSATHISSDHYMSEVLKTFAGKVKRSSERVKSAYRTAAKSINSDTYYGRAVKAID